jgi:hypothetical protein
MQTRIRLNVDGKDLELCKTGDGYIILRLYLMDDGNSFEYHFKSENTFKQWLDDIVSLFNSFKQVVDGERQQGPTLIAM